MSEPKEHDQPDAHDLIERIFHHEYEIGQLKRKCIDQRRHVVYASSVEPGYVCFDVELMQGDKSPTLEWWMWEPVAIVQGPGLNYDLMEREWYYSIGTTRYTAGAVIEGDAPGVRVEHLKFSP